MSDFFTRLLRALLTVMMIVGFIIACLITMWAQKYTNNPILLIVIFLGTIVVMICLLALFGAFVELCNNILQTRINTTYIDYKLSVLLKITSNNIGRNLSNPNGINTNYSVQKESNSYTQYPNYTVNQGMVSPKQ